MATKKTLSKTQRKKPSKPAAAGAILAPGALVITLDAAQQRRAKNCLAQTGKITIGLREVSVTKLGQLVDAEVIVN